MKKSKIVVLSVIILLIILNLYLICGCSNKNTNDEKKQKISEELDFLDIKLIGIANSLNNLSLDNYTISFKNIDMEKQENESSSSNNGSSKSSEDSNSQKSSSKTNKTSNITVTQMKEQSVLDLDENKVDWERIKNEIEIINQSWNAIIVDITNFNVNNDYILGVSSLINDTIISIKNEDKVNTLQNISNLYSYIPKIENEIQTDNNKQNIKQVKSYIINAYALLDKNEWTNIESRISDAEQEYKKIVNDIDNLKDKEYQINNTYVLLKELQNSLRYKDKKLFLVKYKNLIECINAL